MVDPLRHVLGHYRACDSGGRPKETLSMMMFNDLKIATNAGQQVEIGDIYVALRIS